MSNAIALCIIAIMLLVPNTLVAGYGSPMGLALTGGMLAMAGHATASVLAPLVMAGWFGIARLGVCLWPPAQPPRLSLRLVCAGLFSCTVVSLGLIAVTGNSLLFRVGFFGWPSTGSSVYRVNALAQVACLTADASGRS
ncbi:MAG: hypothetical protein EPN34_11010 [Burkholderiaceae bacterium]|nr:MAG: hypothetical protein EPN34_11010 [Burkholderiaceae bacterium]